MLQLSLVTEMRLLNPRERVYSANLNVLILGIGRVPGCVSKKRNRSDKGCPLICTDEAVLSYVNKMDVRYSPFDRCGFKTHLLDDNICFAHSEH